MSNGLERYKVFLHFLRRFAAAGGPEKVASDQWPVLMWLDCPGAPQSALSLYKSFQSSSGQHGQRPAN